jgi:hypothetical protein
VVEKSPSSSPSFFFSQVHRRFSPLEQREIYLGINRFCEKSLLSLLSYDVYRGIPQILAGEKYGGKKDVRTSVPSLIIIIMI